MNEWLKRIEERTGPHKLKVIYRCDNDIKGVVMEIRRDATPDDIRKMVYDPLWWDGDTQGVFHAIEYQKDLCLFQLIPRVVTPSLYSLSRHCDFELAINDRYTLRMNRYFFSVDDRVQKYVATGNSVGMPTGEYGRTTQNNQAVYFGNKVTA